MTDYGLPARGDLGHLRVKEIPVSDKNKVQSLLVLPNHHMVCAGCRNGDIMLFSTGIQLGSVLENKVKAHDSVVKQLINKSEDPSQFYSVSKEHICVWSVVQNDIIKKNTFAEHPSTKTLNISVASFGKNNTIWCCYHDMSLICWDLNTQKPLITAVIEDPITLGAVYLEGSMAIVNNTVWIVSENRVLVMDRETCEVMYIGEAHEKKITSITLVNTCVWTGGSDGRICIWNAQKYQLGERKRCQTVIKVSRYIGKTSGYVTGAPIIMYPVHILDVHESAVHCILQVKDTVFSAGQDEAMIRWKLNNEGDVIDPTTDLKMIPTGHQARISAIASSHERVLWVGSLDSSVSVWV
eukprot:TRINITY_DN18140_c0_g1_i1.p1 TRINITY_DN18140_c0_g1~~TRINITY_DN18140_c0_g1_i1.p1  ORF type:complete len:366 (+),score=67.54 TRINITY_DN18140_c0_g1_i1:40-1098(+)